MRLSCLLLFFIWSGSNAQVFRAEVKDKTFLKAIDLFMDSLKVSDKQLGVITIEISNLNVARSREEVNDEKYGKAFKIKETLIYNLKASFELNLLFFEHHIPTFYFDYRGRVILVYTGAESLVVHSDAVVNKLRRELKHKLPENGTFLSPTWWITITGGEIRFIRKGFS